MTIRWATSSAVAKMLCVSQRTVRRYCEDGMIPPAHYQRTPGGHLRIDIEAVRSLIAYFRKSDNPDIADA